MKPHWLIPILVLLSFPARAGFDEGRAAYDSKDWRTAILELRPLAENGDDRAMILIGNMYNEGYGVDQNPDEAFSLYRRAAGQNNTEAMVAVGAMYTTGTGVSRSMTTALEWYRRAAVAGDQTGAFFYASLLYRGNNSPADDIKSDFYNAYKWFRIASQIEGPDLDIRKASAEFASTIALRKLTPQEVMRADKEVVAWKPLSAKD